MPAGTALKVHMLLWLPVLLWMTLLFGMSAQPAESSNGMSSELAREVVLAAERVGVAPKGTSLDEAKLAAFNNHLRQFAHGFAYFVLALLVLPALRKSARELPKAVSLTMLICAAYAITDEIHQYFVPGRAMELVDFIADMGGALAAAVLYIIAALTKASLKGGLSSKTCP